MALIGEAKLKGNVGDVRAGPQSAASFQHTVVRSLSETTERLAVERRPHTLIVAGGVACNKALRQSMNKAAKRLNVPVYFPSAHLSTDNAAMIAAAGHVKLANGQRDDLTLNADVTLRLQNFENDTDELRRQKVHYRL